MSALATLPVVAPVYSTFGVTADDHGSRGAILRMVSLLEREPDHPAAPAAREELLKHGVVVPKRRGQLALSFSSSVSHYDALISDQQDDLLVRTPDGHGNIKEGGRGKDRHALKKWHKLSPGNAREQMEGLTGATNAFLCPAEFKNWRRRSLLTAMNALYVDIDFHDDDTPPTMGTLQRIAGERVRVIDDTGFPIPTNIHYTGRGFHLYWAHTRLPERSVARWTEVEQWLANTLSGDTNAMDACRLLRVVGTVHGAVGREVTAERIGPSYDFEYLYQQFRLALGHGEVLDEIDDDGDAAIELEDAQEDERPSAVVRDLGAQRARAGVASVRHGHMRAPYQRSIWSWWDLVYRDIRKIIEFHQWQGNVPEGYRNLLLHHLAVALSWFSTSPDALANEIAAENAAMIGLAPEEAEQQTAHVIKRARATQIAQAHAAEGGDFRYRMKRNTLWNKLGKLIPAELIPQMRCIIPDDVWQERRRERERNRSRLITPDGRGRYLMTGAARSDLAQERRDAAHLMRAIGIGWGEIANHLGITAQYARELAAK